MVSDFSSVLTIRAACAPMPQSVFPAGPSDLIPKLQEAFSGLVAHLVYYLR